MWHKRYDGYAALKQFPELHETNPFMAIPLVDRIASGFTLELQGFPNRYGITDFVNAERPKLPGNTDYSLVVDGKLVRVCIHREGIDVTESMEPWWMAESIGFGESREKSEKLFSAVQEFAGRRSLDEWVAEAAAELRKGDVNHLSSHMRGIYLGERK